MADLGLDDLGLESALEATLSSLSIDTSAVGITVLGTEGVPPRLPAGLAVLAPFGVADFRPEGGRSFADKGLSSRAEATLVGLLPVIVKGSSTLAADVGRLPARPDVGRLPLLEPGLADPLADVGRLSTREAGLLPDFLEAGREPLWFN